MLTCLLQVCAGLAKDGIMIMFVLAYVRTRTGEVEDEAFDRHIVFGVDVVCDLGEAFEDVRTPNGPYLCTSKR